MCLRRCCRWWAPDLGLRLNCGDVTNFGKLSKSVVFNFPGLGRVTPQHPPDESGVGVEAAHESMVGLAVWAKGDCRGDPDHLWPNAVEALLIKDTRPRVAGENRRANDQIRRRRGENVAGRRGEVDQVAWRRGVVGGALERDVLEHAALQFCVDEGTFEGCEVARHADGAAADDRHTARRSAGEVALQVHPRRAGLACRCALSQNQQRHVARAKAVLGGEKLACHLVPLGRADQNR